MRQQVVQRGSQPLVEFWKTAAQQGAQVDTFGVVVEFLAVDRQSGRSGKRFRQPVVVE